MNNKLFFFFVVLFLSVLWITGFLCSGGTVQPVITISAVDCPADSIQINGTAIRNNATNNWITTLNVNVKCNGRNIPNAEIKVTYLYSDSKITTNANGDATRRFGPATGDPVGGTVNVTVKGAGDKEVKKDIIITVN